MRMREWLQDAFFALLFWLMLALLVLFSGAPSKFFYVDF